MDRRRFIGTVSALLVAPWAAEARAATATVGILSLATAADFRSRAVAFTEAMKALGHAEGASLRYRWRHAGGDASRLAGLARQLVALRPAVLVADSSAASLRLRQATTGLPVVMVGVEDPVADRFVRSLVSPETNMTGITAGSPDTILESVHLLDTLVKPGSAIAMILNQNNATYRKLRARFRHAAMQDGMRPVMLDANSPGEIAAAFEAAAAERAAGLALMNDAMYFNERARIVKLAAAARVPAIYPDRAFVDAGGLMSYGPDLHGSFARAASFVHRILEGATPASMPVEEPGEPRLRLNAAAARALRLTLPKALRDRASRVG